MLGAEGDRKANMDIMKANKEANREEIKRMREENKELRLKLTQLQKVGAGYCGGRCIIVTAGVNDGNVWLTFCQQGISLKGDENEVQHYQREVSDAVGA